MDFSSYINCIQQYTDRETIESWGLIGVGAVKFGEEGANALCLHVDGARHSGFVFVVYNEKSDLFDIFFTDGSANMLGATFVKDIAENEIGTTIDRFVTGNEPSEVVVTENP